MTPKKGWTATATLVGVWFPHATNGGRNAALSYFPEPYYSFKITKKTKKTKKKKKRTSASTATKKKIEKKDSSSSDAPNKRPLFQKNISKPAAIFFLAFGLPFNSLLYNKLMHNQSGGCAPSSGFSKLLEILPNGSRNPPRLRWLGIGCRWNWFLLRLDTDVHTTAMVAPSRLHA